jgi:hypothetical protein
VLRLPGILAKTIVSVAVKPMSESQDLGTAESLISGRQMSLQHAPWKNALALFVMELLGRVHLPVGLGKKLFRIHAILRIKCCSQAQRQHILAAHLTAGLLRQCVQQDGFLADGPRRHVGRNDDKLVAAHSRRIIVLAANLPHQIGEKLEHFVSCQMAVAVIDFFKSVQIALHDRDGRMLPLTPRKLLFQMDGQSSSIRQPGKEVIGGRTLSLAVLQGVFDEVRNF